MGDRMLTGMHLRPGTDANHELNHGEWRAHQKYDPQGAVSVRDRGQQKFPPRGAGYPSYADGIPNTRYVSKRRATGPESAPNAKSQGEYRKGQGPRR